MTALAALAFGSLVGVVIASIRFALSERKENAQLRAINRDLRNALRCRDTEGQWLLGFTWSSGFNCGWMQATEELLVGVRVKDERVN